MPVDKVLFLGSKPLGLKVLKIMYELAPEKLVGAVSPRDAGDNRSTEENFKEYLREIRIPFHIVKSGIEAEEIIERYSPDLVLVVGWYWLIKSRVLDSVPHGFVGIHNSLLPKYRGSSPLVWQIINGEDKVGFSVFSLTPVVDGGNIWFQDSIPIEQDEFVDSVLYRLQEKIEQSFKALYPKILNEALEPWVQDDNVKSYCGNRIPSDGLIDWRQSARHIYNRIRAQALPYPCAYTRLKGRDVRINRASVLPYVYYGTPGQVAEICSSFVVVICGDNRAIKITEVLDREGCRMDLKKAFISTRSRLY